MYIHAFAPRNERLADLNASQKNRNDFRSQPSLNGRKIQTACVYRM